MSDEKVIQQGNQVSRLFSKKSKTGKRKGDLLTREEEFALAIASRNGDEVARKRLVVSHMFLSNAIASRYRRLARGDEDFNDLKQETAMGLVRAAEKFDPELGFRFSTYAIWWCKAAAQNYLMANHSLMKTGRTTTDKKLFFGLNKATAKVKRENYDVSGLETEQLVAEELGVSVKKITEARQMFMRDMSLNTRLGDGSEDNLELIDLIEDSADHATEYAESEELELRRAFLDASLSTLPDRERDIIIRRRLSEDPVTLDELGAEYGLSKERIRQLEVKGLNTLRKLAGKTRGLGL